jgi:hypothetical protein
MIAATLWIGLMSTTTEPAAPPPALQAPRLDSTDEAAFSATDRKASAFWSRLRPPSIQLLPSSHAHADGRDEFVNDADARLTVQATQGERGMYLLITVTDDEWSPVFKEAGYDSAYDSIELIFDTHSAAQIAGCGKKCRPAPLEKWDLTDKSQQVQFFCDPASPDLRYLRSNPNFFPGETIPVADLPARIAGLALDRFVVGKIRVAEFFISWSQLGVDPNNQQRLGFTVSYHDNDQRRDNPYMINSLRWVNHGNPFSGPDHWGDIELVDAVATIRASASTPAATTTATHQAPRPR